MTIHAQLAQTFNLHTGADAWYVELDGPDYYVAGLCHEDRAHAERHKRLMLAEYAAGVPVRDGFYSRAPHWSETAS
jgi:hypothetical protein